MSDRSQHPSRLSRRRFVAVMAAGSAALLAQPGAAAAPSASPKPAAAGTNPMMTTAQRKEYDRQRASTLDALKTIRSHVMPPGTEMASVFRVRRAAKRRR